VSELRAIVRNRLEQRAWRARDGEAFSRLRGELLARRTDPYSAAEEVLRWTSDS
jgi:hypothetical protein